MQQLRPSFWNSLPGPEDITRVVLPNGIIILTRSNFASPSVVLNGYLSSGCMHDPDDKLGVAYFTSLSLMRGTKKQSFHEIYDALESAGASLGFSASIHNTNFSGRALSEDLPLLLKTLAECILQPAFTPDQVERLRAQILTGLAIRAQDTGETASLKFDEVIFPKHPYGRPEEGYPKTIQAITRADLEEFHRNHYGPQNLVVVIVGAVSPQQAIEEVQRALGDWQNPLQVEPLAFPPVRHLKKSIRKHLPLPGKSQTDLVMGSVGPHRNSPDFLAASLGNSVLGQFGMMGRIGDVVREKAGLAYDASTSLNSWIASGTWEVSAGVNPVNLQKAIDLIISELTRFVKEPVSLEELQDSQSNYIGRLPLSLESNAGVAGALLNLERFHLGLDYYRRYPAMVEAVTPEQILETARHFLDPDKLAIISSGPELV
jgi:zinc protease